MKNSHNHLKSKFISFWTAVACVFFLFGYQNCSSDVGFDSRPSTDRAPGTNTPNNTGPQGPIIGGNGDVIIQINETPRDTTVDNGDTVIDFEVRTPTGTITDVKCYLDGQEIDCDPVDRVDIPNPGLGEHTFTIIGTNNNGQTGEETITWEVFDRIIEKTKVINVTTVSDKVDIIINVDNSGSMEYEQQSMANRVSSFMSKFQHLDYHIAITTTSPIGGPWISSLDYVDGKFVRLSDGNYCIKKSTHSLAQAQAHIQENVVRDLYLRDSNGNPVMDTAQGVPYPEGNGWERPIYTTYRAFERANNNGSNEAGCMRDGVAKHVILISDERETLTDNSGNPLPEQNKSSISGIRALVPNVFGANTVFKFHSIIVNPLSSEGEACLNSHGAKLGVEFANLSLATGGVIGSVCATDYASQLGEIGQTISDSNLSYPLDCVPVSNNGNNGTVSNLPGNIDWEFNGDKIEFSSLLPQGSYTVKYFCFQ